MPPKRKAKALPTASVPKRTRVAKSPEKEPEQPAVEEDHTDRDTISVATSPVPPTPAPAKRRAPRKAATPPLPASKPQLDIFDVPSSSSPSPSADELSRPVVTTKTPSRRKKAVTYKTPSRVRLKTSAAADLGSKDELASAASPMVGKKTPSTKRRVQIAEEREECRKEEVTPRTVARPTAPPRTARKKGTSTAPRTRIQGKMGVGVPAGGEEPTPSAKRTSTVMLLVEDEDVDAQNDAETMDVDPVRDVIVAPASVARPSTTKKKRPSFGRPSFGTDGLEDPFAVPKDAIPAIEEEEHITGITAAKETPKPKPRVKRVAPKPPAKTTIPVGRKQLGKDIEVSADTVEALQHHILGKLMGRQRLNLVGIDEEYSNVHQLLEQTVTAGEGNSMLIIGARGSGKTALIETALSSLADSHAGEFHVVRLNGLLQTDDKLALREIWRQLGVEMELDENDQPKTTNFADTLQSILAILSHPDELRAQAGDDELELDPARTATAVIFILDGFDHFATHPRQTLLYNLFDIAQAKKAPIAVLGLTCKVDVVDTLEKRVKSRFSHRTVHLKLAASLNAFWEVVKEGLSADMGAAALKGRQMEQYAEAWNQYLDNLRETKEFTSLLRSVYATSKTVAPVFNAAILPVSSLSPTSLFPPASAYTRALAPPLSNLALLPSLSDLQLALLISAARLEVLADTETMNFEMVYDEYLKLCTKTRAQATPSGGGIGRVWSKSVAVGAWEGLEKVGLVVPVAGGGRRGGGLWRVDVGLMELRESVKGMQWVRWCKEVL